MLGLPSCARHGCSLPGIFKVEIADPVLGEVTAFVCPLCLLQIPQLLREMSETREERKLLMHQEKDGDEKEAS